MKRLGGTLGGRSPCAGCREGQGCEPGHLGQERVGTVNKGAGWEHPVPWDIQVAPVGTDHFGMRVECGDLLSPLQAAQPISAAPAPLTG